jgi:hypothetical protein
MKPFAMQRRWFTIYLRICFTVLAIQDVQGKLTKSQTEVAELEEELDDAEEDIEVSYISELVGYTTVYAYVRNY